MKKWLIKNDKIVGGCTLINDPDTGVSTKEFQDNYD